MTFVNERSLLSTREWMFPLVRLCRRPHLCTEYLRIRVLNCPRQICREPFTTSSGPIYPQLVQIPVMEKDIRKTKLPISVSYRRKGIGTHTLPVIAFTYEIDHISVRRPLAQHPAILVPVQSIVEMGISLAMLAPSIENLPMPIIYSVFPWLEPRVRFINRFHKRYLFAISPNLVRFSEIT